MAESRQKIHHILLSTDGKNTAVELFDARQWPDKSSNDGEFRVRIDGRWYSPAGKYTFLSHASLGDLIARLLSGQEVFEEQAPPVPLTVLQRVRVHYGDCVGSVPVQITRGFVAAPPHRGVDGRWYVAVCIGGSTVHFLCHDVEPIRRP